MNRRRWIAVAKFSIVLLLAGGTIWVLSAMTHIDRDISSGHAGAVNALAFSPDGQLLASGSTDGTVKLWSVATRKEQLVLQGQEAGRHGMYAGKLSGYPVHVLAVAFTPDGQTLAAGTTDETVKLWKVSTGEALADFKADATPRWGPAEIVSLAFTPDNSTLAAEVRNRGEGLPGPCGVVFWEMASGKQVRALKGQPHVSNAHPQVAFTADGASLALADCQKVTLCDVATGQERSSLQRPEHNSSITALAISTDGKLLASGDSPWDSRGTALPSDVVLWELATGKELLALKEHTRHVYSLSFTADGKLLASASRDGTVRLWELPSGRQRAVLRGHTGSVFAVALSPDGTTLASGGEDGAIRLWDVAQVLSERAP